MRHLALPPTTRPRGVVLRRVLAALAASAASTCAVGLGGALPAPAAAQDGSAAAVRAVVYPFDGPRRDARRARDVVEEAIGGTVSLVGADEIRAAVVDFEIDLEREEAPLELATAVAAPMVFLGAVEGRGERLRTVVRAVDANGDELGRREAGSPRTPTGRDELAAAAQELAVEATLVLEQRREAQAAAAREAEVEQARAVQLDEELLEEVEGADEDADGGDAFGGVPRYPAVQVTAGLTFRNRNVTIERAPPASAPDAAVVDATYEIGLFPELALRLEARPLTGSGPVAAGLVLWLDGGIAFGVRSETEPPDPTELDTTVYHVEGGAGYLYPIDALQVGVNVAVGYDAFQLEDNDILPSMSYGYLRLGLDGRLWLAGGAVEPRVFFGYRVVVATNDGFVDTFASESTLGGLDVGAGVAGVIAGGLTYLAKFEYVRWNLSFDGAPSEDLAPRGVSGSDDGIRLTIMAGWSF